MESFIPRRATCADIVYAVGLAVMVGQVPAMWNVLASDAVAHLCNSLPVLSITYCSLLTTCKAEEVKDSALVTPQTMFWSYM